MGVISSFSNWLGKRNDPTLDITQVKFLSLAYGYSEFEVRNLTREMREQLADAAAKGEAPATPAIRPEQARLVEVSFFDEFKKQLVTRTKVLVPKLKVAGVIGAVAVVVGIVGIIALKVR